MNNWQTNKKELLKLLKLDPPDKGMVKVINAFNQSPNIATISSCEGHGKHPESHLYFFTETMQFPHEVKLMQAILKTANEHNICLGCLRVKLAKDNHFDCANDIKQAWELTIEPRHDYGKEAKPHMAIMWETITEFMKTLNSSNGV